MTTKELNIYDLLPASYNPRKELSKEDEEYQNIKESIESFGYVDPIIVNKDMTVIGGHQRLNVLKDLGYKKVLCVIVDIDKDKEKALNIALNKISGFWDNDKLTELLEELNNINMAHMTGFSQDEIDNYLKDMDIEQFYEGGDNDKEGKKSNEKQCPECGILINVDDWKIVE